MLNKLKGRTPAEVRFRLRQEWGNVTRALFPPRLGSSGMGRGAMAMARVLPDPSDVLDRIRQSAVGAEIIQVADEALTHRFRLLGYQVQLGDPIPWRRDYIHCKDQPETPLQYFRRIPYLNFERVGDHKVIWELNRHQHLIALAQAWRLTGERRYLDGIVEQVKSWWQANPFHQGINWTSALEVAFRALSWIWVDHLAGRDLPAEFRAKLVESLYQHGCHLEYNLSRYFAPNTHLQGEAVTLHALGVLYPHMPLAQRWVALGRGVLDEELRKQVRADGGHFEQSSYYHVYATDFFLLHYLLAGRPAHFQPVLERMAGYLHALIGAERRLTFTGDDDGGRVFHPYGAHDQFGRATLASCALLFGRPEWLASDEDLMPQAAWWLGGAAFGLAAHYAPPVSQLFADTGVAILCRGKFWVEADVGPFGPYTGGHSHADTLSIVVRVDGQEILTDPGTYTYMSDPVWRDRFRGSAAHNTICVDGRDHVPVANPFAWAARPAVRLLKFEVGADRDLVHAEWEYEGIRHERLIELDAGGLKIRDTVHLTPGEHKVQQFWHPGLAITLLAPAVYRIGADVEMVFETPGASISCESGREVGWRAPVYGMKEEAPVICVKKRAAGTMVFETRMYVRS